MTSRVLVALRIDAAPARVFEAFTAEIGEWWRPNALFRPSRSADGRISIETGVGGRVLASRVDGEVDVIGQVLAWDEPDRLVFSWRPTSFGPDQATEVHVRFESVDGMTRVVVEHVGWDQIPQDHVARHDFPLDRFQRRLADWWQDLLASLDEHSAGTH
ncbi:MAG: SRPBCC domain-containing protein [Ilumatobacteraceae bacterium]